MHTLVALFKQWPWLSMVRYLSSQGIHHRMSESGIILKGKIYEIYDAIQNCFKVLMLLRSYSNFSKVLTL